MDHYPLNTASEDTYGYIVMHIIGFHDTFFRLQLRLSNIRRRWFVQIKLRQEIACSLHAILTAGNASTCTQG